MAKKFSIIQNATFKQNVKIPRVGGEPIDVEFEYKYFTRPQLDKINQEWQEASTEMLERWEKVKQETGSLPPLPTMNEEETSLNVKQLKDIVVGWQFDEEFNDENIRALVESSVGASDAVISSYNQAYQKAKLGN